MSDGAEDLCADSLPFFISPKKKKKKKRKLEELNGEEEAEERWVNPAEDAENDQTSKRKKDSQWVVKESDLESEMGIHPKRKKKKTHRSKEQDIEHIVPETPEEILDHLEDANCEVRPKKKKKKAAKESLEDGEGLSIDKVGFAKDAKELVIPSDIEDVLQNGAETTLSAPRKPHKKLKKHKKHRSSSPNAFNDNPEMAKDGEQDQSERHPAASLGKQGPLPPSSEPLELDNEFFDSPDVVSPDLESLTRELEEFIPDIRRRPEEFIRQLARRDLLRFRNFKKQGIALKFGKFSRGENALLRRNVEAFLEESGIDSAEKLLFTHRFPEEKDALKKLKARHLFGLKIAQGIPRPWRLVYYRARKMFDPQNYVGRYSAEELHQIKKYQAQFGNNWKKMSELMGRSSHSLELKYYDMIAEFNTGPWTKEETQKLIGIVKGYLEAKADPAKKEGPLMLRRENLYKGIPWFRVQEQMGSRWWKQCKEKWLSLITKKMSGGKLRNHGLESLKFRIELIERLYDLNVEDVEDIDWEDLSHLIGNVPPDYTKSRFYLVRTLYVPFWTQKGFSEAIDHLYTETLPKLKAQLERKKNIPEMEERSWKSTFRFSDIFPEEEEVEEEEEEGSIFEEEEEPPREAHSETQGKASDPSGIP
nr:transcription termination factor 1 [Anolis sagrei ordinatus]XP_060613120.1 transcription termination factor 1 [Anolis sagrei ordinatus]XP_060613121.1 transcription termination factor 1 [Anolis sagrei ordinatus]XP_060613122.1 transcription termination factor 1 [Anolis sagrei ordinatus]